MVSLTNNHTNMNTVLLIFLILMGLGLVMYIISRFLPQVVHYELSMPMQAPVEDIFNQVNDLKKWNKWSPWSKRDPEMKIQYFDKTEGVDGGYSWVSKSRNVGSGSMKILESKPHEYIKIELNFMQQGASKAFWKFEPFEGSTVVTWGIDADMGSSPQGRFMGLLMPKFLAADFKEGLEGLKATVES